MNDPSNHDEAALAQRRDAVRRADMRRRGRMFTWLGAGAAVGAIAVAVATPQMGWSLALAAAWFGARGVWLQRSHSEPSS